LRAALVGERDAEHREGDEPMTSRAGRVNGPELVSVSLVGSRIDVGAVGGGVELGWVWCCGSAGEEVEWFGVFGAGGRCG